jgi:hypothetical protein
MIEPVGVLVLNVIAGLYSSSFVVIVMRYTAQRREAPATRRSEHRAVVNTVHI